MELSELKHRLLALDTACLSDADKTLRIIGSHIRPLRPGLKLFGPAHTVRCREDFLTVLKGLDEAAPGEVLVIDTGASRSAVVGELIAIEAERKGLGGIVVDGACRDSARLETLGIPVYAHSITPRSGTARELLETGTEIECGGVRVAPGDLLYGDDDGIVVGSADELEEVLPKAELIQNAELRVIAAMGRGASLFERLDYHAHRERLGRGEPGELGFLL